VRSADGSGILAAARLEAHEEPALTQRLQLLMVEDQRFDAMLLRKLLETPLVGAERIDHAESLAGAIDLLERHLYDAVVLDLGLPDSDTVAGVRRLCTQFPTVAIVVLTGRDEERVGIEAMEAGAQDKLDKAGLDAAQLAHSLHYAIARQRLEEDLRQSAEDHRILFENNPLPLLVYEVNTLRFLAANAAAVHQYGYSQEEFLARSLRDVWSGEDAERALASIKSMTGANLRNEEWRHCRKDGSVFDVEINALPTTFRGRRARIVLARDITVRKRAIKALEISELRFRNLFQYSLGLICMHDVDGTLTSINPAAARALGFSVAELLGRNLVDLVPQELRHVVPSYLERICTKGEDSGVLYLTSRSGEPRIWEYHNILDDTIKDEPYVLGHALDITDRRLYERKLKEQSIRDPLTGCYNRRYLEEYASALAPAASWGCIAVDLDHFKQINDTYGHQRGDEVLIGVGRFLMHHARAKDIVIRMGGDEFLLVLRDANANATQDLAGKIIAAAPTESPSDLSIGWAVRESEETLEATLNRADGRLYAIRAAARA